jgi:hypothetical protein
MASMTNHCQEKKGCATMALLPASQPIWHYSHCGIIPTSVAAKKVWHYIHQWHYSHQWHCNVVQKQ